ncbi:MAG: MerR family transcriptional regulator [Turneriella sp.]
MRLTAKRLSELTQVPAANIRKWRERYDILLPERGDNGYLYYTSDDYRVVLSIRRLLDQGKKLSVVMQEGRDKLLELAPKTDYDNEELRMLEAIIEGRFSELGNEFDKLMSVNGCEQLIRKKIWPLTILIGKAWESGFITVGTEHAYSRWMMGYLSQLATKLNRRQAGERLFVAFPGDEHELGAMMHFVLMTDSGHGGKFSGALPMEKLFEELSHGDYEELHVSATIPKARAEIDRFVSAVHKKYPRIKVKIGGCGAKVAS